MACANSDFRDIKTLPIAFQHPRLVQPEGSRDAPARRAEAACVRLTHAIGAAATFAAAKSALRQAELDLSHAQRGKVPEASLRALKAVVSKARKTADLKERQAIELATARMHAARGNHALLNVLSRAAALSARQQSAASRAPRLATGEPAVDPPAWTREYVASGGNGNVVEHELTNRRVLVDESNDRIVGMFGIASEFGRDGQDRDATAMKRFATQREAGTDSGHLLAHVLGGGEEHNLVAMDPALNRGHGERQEWVSWEAKVKPGDEVYVRCFYEGGDPRPVEIEAGSKGPDGVWNVVRVDNRRSY